MRLIILYAERLPTINPPPKHIIDLAYKKIEEFENDWTLWPEDDWFGLGDQYDLNLHINDVDGSKHAEIYPVAKDGQTWTGAFYEVPLKEI